MAIIFMWIGIGLIVLGWLALGWQASKRLAVKDEIEKFPERKRTMQLNRNYCWLTMIVGVVMLLVSLII